MPTHQTHRYAGAETGGIYRLPPHPENRQQLTHRLPPSPSIRAIAIHHQNPEITANLTPSENALDLHGIQCAAAAPRTAYITTRQGPITSPDHGSHWPPAPLAQYSETTYTRDLKAAPHDPNTHDLTISAAARNRTSAPYPSPDLLQTFQRLDHTITPNSTTMAIAIAPRAPRAIACAARNDQIFRTTNHGITRSAHPHPTPAAETRTPAAA